MSDTHVELQESLAVVVDEAYGRVETPDWLTADLHGWRALLVSAVKHADEQLTTLTAREKEWKVEKHDPDAYREGRADFSGRRSRVVHFKRKVEARLVQVNARIRAEGRTIHDESSDPTMALARAARLWRTQYGGGDDQLGMFAVAAVDAWNHQQNGDTL